MSTSSESIVYLLRKTNLNLHEIGELEVGQFKELITELQYQEAVDHYWKQYTTANILAAIYNTIPRKRGHSGSKAGDFLSGGMPQRETRKQDSLEKLATDRGIKLPSKEIKER